MDEVNLPEIENELGVIKNKLLKITTPEKLKKIGWSKQRRYQYFLKPRSLETILETAQEIVENEHEGK